MKIDSVNFSVYNRTNKKSAINFKASTGRSAYKIKKAILNAPESKAVYEKATKLLNILPSGKMETTSLCKVNQKQFGIRWDTKNKDLLKLKIKDNIETTNTDEWNKTKDSQTVLDCVFDSNGVMQKGYLTKKLKNGYSINALYQKDANNRKIVIIDGVTYRQYPANEDYWTSVPILSCYMIKKDINLKEFLEQAELAELFCELIKKNTTIK